MFELAKSPSANIFDATFVVIVFDLREDFILNMRSFGFDAILDQFIKYFVFLTKVLTIKQRLGCYA